MNKSQVSNLVRLPVHRKGLMWEQPLGVVRGFLDEPPSGFVDPYEEEERKAIEEIDNGSSSEKNNG